MSHKRGADWKVPKAKKRRGDEMALLRDLPNSSAYEVSYMHRETLSHVVVARNTEFIITASTDGHVKFWRKMPKSIEFVKRFMAHVEPLVSFVLSKDDQRLLTASTDKTVKLFEVAQFDMAGMIDLGFVPAYAAWLGTHEKIVVSEVKTSQLYVYDTDGDDPSKVLTVLDRIHMHPVTHMALVQDAGVMISVDTKGLIEYWSNDDYQFISNQNSKFVNFRMKSETSLFELAKSRMQVVHLEVARTGKRFVVTCTNRTIMVFDFATGKKICMIDESAASYAEEGALAVPASSGDEAEVGTRLKQLVDLEATSAAFSATFDKTGDILVYGCPLGVKMVMLSENEGKLLRIVGTEDFDLLPTGLALYQGVPKVDKQYLLAKKKEEEREKQGTRSIDLEVEEGSQSISSSSSAEADPVLFMSAYKKRRLYCLSTRLPKGERDRINEKLSASELAMARNTGEDNPKSLPSEAVLHTSKGDVFLQLFPAECPRTVENFVGHAQNNYYNGTIFHRVIKGFMIQGGDPSGDGTGGESIWGGSFEDEFHPKLRHTRPFTLSMANAGPNTNGSQFFITTAPTPHLDDKHTVFGKVTKGFEVVGAIENSPVGLSDRPLNAIKILGIDC